MSGLFTHELHKLFDLPASEQPKVELFAQIIVNNFFFMEMLNSMLFHLKPRAIRLAELTEAPLHLAPYLRNFDSLDERTSNNAHVVAYSYFLFKTLFFFIPMAMRFKESFSDSQLENIQAWDVFYMKLFGLPLMLLSAIHFMILSAQKTPGYDHASNAQQGGMLDLMLYQAVVMKHLMFSLLARSLAALRNSIPARYLQAMTDFEEQPSLMGLFHLMSPFLLFIAAGSSFSASELSLKELPSLALLLVVCSNQVSEVASLIMEKGLALAKKIETVFKNIEKALTPMATEFQEPMPQATVGQEAGARIPEAPEGATLFLILRLRKKDTVSSEDDFTGVNALD